MNFNAVKIILKIQAWYSQRHMPKLQSDAIMSANLLY